MNLLFVLLSSCGGLLCSCCSFAFPLCGFLRVPATTARKEVPSWWRSHQVLRARLLQMCVVMQARPPVRQLPLCLVASLSPAPSLCVSASQSFSLPPSCFFRSLSTPLTRLLPQPTSSSASGIHSKKHTLLGSAPRLRSHGQEGGGGSSSQREEGG